MKKQIRAYLETNEADMIADLQTIIAIPSMEGAETAYPFGDEVHKALEAMLALGEKYGFETENLDNKVGKIYLNKGVKGKEMGIWAHLDIVAPGDTKHWQADPYTVVDKDGFLLGRGVGDNKGAAITSLYAFRYLKENNISLGYPVVLYLGLNEETGMDDLNYFVKNHPAPYLSLVPDSHFPTCIGEKAVNTIVIKSNEHLSSFFTNIEAGLAHNIVPPAATATCKDGLVIEGVGSSGHSAYPDGSENAIYDLMTNLLKLDSISDTDRETFTFIQTVTKEHYGEALGIALEDSISGKLTCVGTILSMEDQKLKLSFNIRCPIMANEIRVFEVLNSAAMRENFSAEHAVIGKPYYFAGDPVFVDILNDIYNTETASNHASFTMAGGTYAHKLPNAIGFGIKSPVKVMPDFIPANHGGPHQPNEAISKKEFKEAIEMYILTCVKLEKHMI